MPKRRAVVELSATRLELTVLSGDEVAASKSQRLDIPEYGEGWPRTLESVAPQLKQLVTSCNAEDLHATLIYHSPTSAVIVSAVPASAPRKESIQAAGLALADASNRPLKGNPHDLERIWSDAPQGATVMEAAPNNAHILGIADSEESAGALARLLKAADLRPADLIPAEAPSFVAAVDSVLDRSKATSGTVVALYFGEHTSVLAAATAGRLRFVRRVGTGSEMFVDALARELRPSGDAQPVTLSRSTAAELLFRNGIPARGQVFDAQSGLNADVILPLVQPALQRCIIEIKQSIRFGLDEKERGTAKLVCLGLGARIGRLPQLVSEQTNMPLDDASPAASPGECDSTTSGLILQWITGRKLVVQLLPSFVHHELTAQRVRRGMLAGFAAAAAMIAFSGVSVRMDLAKQLERVQMAQANLDATKPITDLNNRMIAAQTGVTNAKQRINARLANTMPWDAVMAMLTQCTPPTVKINESQMTLERGKPVCRVTGQTPLPPGNDTNIAVRTYLDALGAIPLVKATRLGATQRGDSEGGPIISFEITIMLVDLPTDATEPKADVAAVPVEKEDLH